MTLLEAQKYLPFATVVAIAACVTVAGGIFRFAGTEWMAFLEFADILAISWPVIPFVLVTLLGGAAAHSSVALFPQNTNAGRPRDGFPVPGGPKAGSLTRIAFGLGLAIVFAFFPLTTMLSPTFGFLPFFLMFVAFMLMTPGMAKLPISPLLLSCLSAFMLLAFAYAYGVWTGASGFVKRPDDVVVVQGESLCVEVLVLTRRGPIVIENQRAAQFFPWEDVSSVSVNSGCPSA